VSVNLAITENLKVWIPVNIKTSRLWSHRELGALKGRVINKGRYCTFKLKRAHCKSCRLLGEA